MKQLVKSTINFVINIMARLTSSRGFKYLNIRFNHYYSNWLSKQFKTFGANSSFNRPLYLLGGQYISVGTNFHSDQRLRLEAIDSFLSHNFAPKLVIGDNVMIQKDCHIASINEIRIGNNVLIASKVFISDHSHGKFDVHSLGLPPLKRNLISKGPVVIEDNVWIGEGCVILGGVTIGENSIISANTVVNKSIGPNCLVTGPSFRVIQLNK